MSNFNYLYTNVFGAIKTTGSGCFSGARDDRGKYATITMNNLDIKYKLNQEIVYKYINSDSPLYLGKEFKINVNIDNNIDSIKEYEYIYSDLTDVRYIEVIKHLLTYLNNTQKRSLNHLQKVKVVNNKENLYFSIISTLEAMTLHPLHLHTAY